MDTAELNLLLPWREPITPQRLLRDGIGSVLINGAIFAFFVFAPAGDRFKEHRVISDDLHKAVHLYLPRVFEPTQTAPNHGKVSRELDVNSMNETRQRQAPRFRAPAPAPGPLARASIPAPAPAVIQPPKIQQQPPKIEVAQPPPPPTGTAAPQPPALAPPQPVKPKLAFEDVATTPPDPVIPPNRRSPSTPSGENGTMVGDLGDASTTVQGANQAASPGRIGSNLQLLSDAKGVDFKPYLVQVLMAVRRNWLAIIPESARMGRRGRVLIQFAIDRQGGVPKLVIAEGTGMESLDRAAVAAISASYPFPPLPTEYKGDEIRLQLAFAYNVPAR
ncbi:MAG TPA: TonB family protein [Bryobacteraceae bacterium]|nr:TonB family protein [Bryobacteraceae bacterium]